MNNIQSRVNKKKTLFLMCDIFYAYRTLLME